jgi:hypothetical protein
MEHKFKLTQRKGISQVVVADEEDSGDLDKEGSSRLVVRGRQSGTTILYHHHHGQLRVSTRFKRMPILYKYWNRSEYNYFGTLFLVGE